MSQKYQFVATHASQYPVVLLCRVLGVARSGYYAWCRGTPSQRQQADAVLTDQIRAVFQTTRQCYGSPRIHAELQEQQVRCAKKRVARLMRLAGLVARPQRRRIRTTQSQHAHPIAPNLLDRAFYPDAPDAVWVADITYLPTAEGWCYLAVVLDLYARRVVGWALQTSLARELALTALRQALARRQPPPGLIHHSDRGSQYASADYQALLEHAQIQCSMSRTGNCWDNTPMESFFSTLKAELPMTDFPTVAAARSAIFDYIERFYNRQRRHSTLQYQSPVAYERRYEAQLATA
jgi:putative transposase